MPELPEVEHVAAGLRTEILNSIIDKITVHTPVIVKSPRLTNWQAELNSYAGQRISEISRRAKRLILTIAPNRILIVQLGMTGRFMLYRTGQSHLKHTHFSIHIRDGRRLDFVDPRRFGWLWILGPVVGNLESIMEQVGFGKLGPEPFNLKPSRFNTILQSERPIKNLLLDQTRIAGLGNIYADESLFAAGIDPRSVSCRIPPDRVETLRRAIPKILRRSIRNGGTTFSDFHNPYGEPGRFLNLLQVYGREAKPCQTCRTPIQRTVLSNRSAHFCPACQIQY